MNAVSQTPAMFNLSLFFKEYIAREYVCMVPSKLEFEKVLEPEYWMHEGTRLKKWDRIEIRPDDMSYVAELIVTDSGNLFAKVALLYKHAITSRGEKAENLTVENIGATWRVRRGKAVLIDNLPDELTATRWIDDHTDKPAALKPPLSIKK